MNGNVAIGIGYAVAAENGEKKENCLGAYYKAYDILGRMSRTEKPQYSEVEKSVLYTYKDKRGHNHIGTKVLTKRVVSGGEEYLRLKGELEASIEVLRNLGEPVVDGKIDRQRMHEAVSLVKWKQLQPGQRVTLDARRKVYQDAWEFYSEKFLAGFRAPARRH